MVIICISVIILICDIQRFSKWIPLVAGCLDNEYIVSEQLFPLLHAPISFSLFKCLMLIICKLQRLPWKIKQFSTFIPKMYWATRFLNDQQPHNSHFKQWKNNHRTGGNILQMALVFIYFSFTVLEGHSFTNNIFIYLYIYAYLATPTTMESYNND